MSDGGGPAALTPREAFLLAVKVVHQFKVLQPNPCTPPLPWIPPRAVLSLILLVANRGRSFPPRRTSSGSCGKSAWGVRTTGAGPCFRRRGARADPRGSVFLQDVFEGVLRVHKLLAVLVDGFYADQGRTQLKCGCRRLPRGARSGRGAHRRPQRTGRCLR